VLGFTANFFVGRRLLRRACRALRLEFGEVAAVDVDTLFGDVQDTTDHRIEEIAIVRHDEQRPLISTQPSFQPKHGIEIEMVGRLIEQQHVRRTHQCAREVGTHP